MAKQPSGDWAWLGSGEQIFIPDVKITADDPTYVLHPVRGYSGSLAVEDISEKIIGWMPVEVTGHNTVREWMDAVKWVGPGRPAQASEAHSSDIRIETHRKPTRDGSPGVYLIHRADARPDSRPLGFLEKYADTRDEVHPWKAYAFVPGVRDKSTYLGAFYKGDGGKDAAIQAILDWK